ncbi:MAG: 16S rRNA (cytosine(967)-C(5))-methyltransferase RsmB [Bacilli bacterium]|nr:16S rRNA (cytosine(967)-C(5))-methyltransferase RsmB [Bacilli bacterium]
MNVRKLAVDAIDKIMTNNAYSNIVVNDVLNKFELSDEDRGLFTNLVYGTLQHLLTIEYYISPFIAKKKPKHWVRYLLYMSVYQIVYLKTADYAVVNEATSIARVKDKQIASFVNGVLRNFLRTPLIDIEKLKDTDEVEYLSVKYSHPAWLVAFFLKDYSFEVVEEILKENTFEKKDAIRVNTLKTTKSEVKFLLDNLGIGYTESEIAKDALVIDGSIVNTELFKDGYVTIQDISSQLTSLICDPQENSYVLDLCSAPGGKVAYMAALMKNTGIIYACDIYQHKIKLMNDLFTRLGVKNVKPQLIDARMVHKHVKEGCFDYVLADVPCSGLGVISHKVDLKYRISLDAIDNIIALQEEILESTWKLVKVSGYYVYSTCTINKDENELLIKRFLKKHPNFEVIYEKQILPIDYHTDGFYICKMRRNDE